MVSTLAISKHVNSLLEVETRFSAQQANGDRFFTEWYENLPELTETEKEHCDRIKDRYLYHRHYGHINEGLVNQIVITPLLEMANFYDPPFDIRSEYPVQIEFVGSDEEEEEAEIIYRGRIDTIVINKKLWVLVIESKGTSFNVEEGMAQALTYMLASPNRDRPTYGFISNGGSSIFVKATNTPAQYIFSDDFSLYRRQNELYGVLSTLKNIAKTIQV
jgi:hypothetical protein